MRRRFRSRPIEGDELVDLFFEEEHRSSGTDRKLKQLCREVYRVLAQVLPGDVLDPVLDGVSVLEVQPAPDGSRLAVHLHAPPGTDLAAVLAHLEKLKGALRAEIAQAIQRKRTPDLVFEVHP